MQGEKSVLGFYISDHPLSFYKQDIARYGATIDGDLDSLDSRCVLAGMVVGVRTHQSKNGEMAWVTLESGITGLPEITIFNDAWMGCKGSVVKDKVVIVKGIKRHDVRFGWGIIANEVIAIDRARPDAEVLSISMPNTDVMDLLRLKSLGSDDGANVQVVVECGSTGRLALVATGLLIPPTGANLSALETQGWTIDIDPQSPESLSFNGSRTTSRNSCYGGAGPERKHTMELPIVKSALKILDGRFVTELAVT
jgi:DNA polymerase-3 subunit alpha